MRGILSEVAMKGLTNMHLVNGIELTNALGQWDCNNLSDVYASKLPFLCKLKFLHSIHHSFLAIPAADNPSSEQFLFCVYI